jgi:hypothetical protein
MSFEANHPLATQAQTEDALSVGIAISAITLLVSVTVLGLMLFRLYSLGWTSDLRSKDGLDMRLMWPQVFVAGATLLYALLNLVTFNLDYSSAISAAGCNALARVLLVLFDICKVGVFLFLVRKAQIVDCTGNAHRFAFYALYTLIFCYSVSLLGAAATMYANSVVNAEGFAHCSFNVSISWIGSASLFEFFIAVGSFFIFLKPLLSVSSKISSSQDAEDTRRKKALRGVILANFLYGSSCLGASYALECYMIYCLGHELPFSELVKASGIMQLDLLFGLTTIMLSTRILWFEKYQASARSRRNSSHHSSGRTTVTGIPTTVQEKAVVSGTVPKSETSHGADSEP